MSELPLFIAGEVKLLLFDATETLVYIPRGVGAHYAEVAEEMGVAVDAATLQAAFRQAFRAMAARPSNAVPRADDDRGWWRTLVFRVLDDCLPTLEATAFEREEYFDRVYALFADPAVWAVYPDVIPALDSLRARFRCGVVSNFDGRLRGILTGLGLAPYFEHVIISSEVGADKPEPLIFQIALERFRTAPEHALHIGDHPDLDWRAAQRAGLGHYELKRPQHDLAALTPPLLHPHPRERGPEHSALL